MQFLTHIHTKSNKSRQAFLEGVIEWYCKKLFSGKQPVKDADDSHAVEDNFVLVQKTTSSTVKLKLKGCQISAIR